MASERKGHFIKEWREHTGLTQKKFAEFVGMSTSNYNYLETGKIGYTQSSLELIAKALQVRPSALLSTNPLEAPTGEPDPIHDLIDSYETLSPDGRDLVFSLVRTIAAQEEAKSFKAFPNLKAKSKMEDR